MCIDMCLLVVMGKMFCKDRLGWDKLLQGWVPGGVVKITLCVPMQLTGTFTNVDISANTDSFQIKNSSNSYFF